RRRRPFRRRRRLPSSRSAAGSRPRGSSTTVPGPPTATRPPPGRPADRKRRARMERDEIERLVTGLDADQLRRLLGRVQRALGDAAPAATPPGLRLTNVGDAPLTVEREPGRPERLAPGESTTVAPGDVAADRAAGEADAAHPLAAERIR